MLMSAIYELESLIQPLDVSRIFASAGPLEVELGSGDGSFLANYASLNSERNFLGVERLLGRLNKMDRKIRRAGLTNVRGLRIESGYFLRYLLPAEAAAALHIYFPDPWPKRRHRHHRLVNEQFPLLAHTVLGAQGRIYLRTDDPDYFEQMQRVFDSHSLFKAVPTPAELEATSTDFESDFQAKGVTILRAAFEKT
jgi:tRNA (guanine-N7-)-methyltransferase